MENMSLYLKIITFLKRSLKNFVDKYSNKNIASENQKFTLPTLIVENTPLTRNSDPEFKH